MSHLKELNHACNISCMEAHGRPCYSHRELLAAIKTSLEELRHEPAGPPTAEQYDRIFQLEHLLESVKRSFDARAADIVKLLFGETGVRFNYTKTDVYVDDGRGYDHPHYFKVEWLWDSDWRLRIEEHQAEQHRRSLAYMEMSRKHAAEEQTRKDLEELKRLREKYPNA